METPWPSLYAELTNKLRWAISSTCSQIPLQIPFKDSMAVAALFAGPVLDALQEWEAHPDLNFRGRMEEWAGGVRRKVS